MLAFISLLFTLAAAPTQASTDALPTVAQVDLDRYVGRWYEISRLPMWFERNCTGDITATYALRSDDRMDVINRCRTQNGFISARGVAEIPNPAHPGQLRVRFAPDWLAWLPVVWGDYWIIDLDPEYRWVMVGAPSRGYLWILARSPALDQATVAQLKNKATGLGFDVTSMINVTNSTE
jgi:apolipoprotein D and lipocalin family protein